MSSNNNKATVEDGEFPPVSVYLGVCEEGATVMVVQGEDRIYLDLGALPRLLAALAAQGLPKAA